MSDRQQRCAALHIRSDGLVGVAILLGTKALLQQPREVSQRSDEVRRQSLKRVRIKL